MTKYVHLFSPIKIGKKEVKNRVFMPPISTNLANKGYVTEELIKHYSDRAKGGVGLIVTEVVRSGITSISNDQTEAGLAVGLSNFKTFLFIILPQALKNSMASIGNELIVNIKDTSVLSVILIVDLYNACKLAGATYGAFVEPMLIAAAIYFILTSFFSIVLRLVEKRLGAPTKALTSSN